MKRLFVFCVVLLTGSGFNAHAAAEPVTYSFTASVSLAYLPPTVRSIFPTLAVGDTVHGTFTYDSAASDGNPNPGLGLYVASGTPYRLSVTIEGKTFSSSGVRVSVVNDDTMGIAPDGIFVHGTPISELPSGVQRLGWFWVGLDSRSASVFQSDSLPVSLPRLEQFDVQRSLMMTFYDSAGQFAEVDARLTSLVEGPPRPPFPVVFVHGLCSSSATWYPTLSTLQQSGWTWGGIADSLLGDSRNADFYAVDFADRVITSGLASWAEELSADLARIAAERQTPSKFIVVAHSAGGLAARHYMQSTSYRNDIAHLITYGTPHLGTRAAAWRWLAAWSGWACPNEWPWVVDNSSGVREMDPESGEPFLDALNSRDFAAQDRVTTLVGNQSFCSALVPGQNDCVVSTDSQSIANVPHRPLQFQVKQTSRRHDTQPEDVSNILWAVYAFPRPITNRVVFNVASPVDIVVTDPDGRRISKDANEIPFAAYEEVETEPGHLQDFVTIPVAGVGAYSIEVVAHADAQPTETFSISVQRNDIVTPIAEQIPVGSIPSEPYTVALKPALGVELWIKDGTRPVLNPDSHGKVRLAVLSTSDFDAVREIVQASIRAGRDGREPSVAFCNGEGEDVNADGRPDLVCHMKTQLLDMGSTDQTLVFTAQTYEGRLLHGTTAVVVLK